MNYRKRPTHIEFRHLKWRLNPDDKHTEVVTSLDTGVSLELDIDKARIAKMLYQGYSVKKIHRDKGYSYSEIYTLLDLLKRTEFISQIDQKNIPATFPKVRALLGSTPSQLFTWILSPAFGLFFGLFVFCAIVLFIFVPETHPHYTDFFWNTDYRTVVIINFVVLTLLTLFHETAHFVVTRAIGGQANITISQKMFYIIFQTTSYYINDKSKRERILVYLAGIITDIFSIAVLIWMISLLVSFGKDTTLSILFLRSLILQLTISIAWQANIFLQTDLYNVFTELLDIPDLFEQTKQYLLHRTKYPLLLKGISFLFAGDEYDKLSSINRFDRDKIPYLQFFTILFILGLILTSVIFFGITIPRDFQFINDAFTQLFDSTLRWSLLEIVKNIFCIGLVMQQYLLLIFLFLRKNHTGALGT